MCNIRNCLRNTASLISRCRINIKICGYNLSITRRRLIYLRCRLIDFRNHRYIVMQGNVLYLFFDFRTYAFYISLNFAIYTLFDSALLYVRNHYYRTCRCCYYWYGGLFRGQVFFYLNLGGLFIVDLLRRRYLSEVIRQFFGCFVSSDDGGSARCQASGIRRTVKGMNRYKCARGNNLHRTTNIP